MNQSGALAEFLIIIHPGFQANIEPTQDSGLDFCLPWADRHNGKVLFSSVPVHPPPQAVQWPTYPGVTQACPDGRCIKWSPSMNVVYPK